LRKAEAGLPECLRLGLIGFPLPMSAGNSRAGGALPSPILLCSISLKNEMSFDSITIETRFPFQTTAAEPTQRDFGEGPEGAAESFAGGVLSPAAKWTRVLLISYQMG